MVTDYHAFVRPLATVDVVIFALAVNELRVLLVKRPSEPGEPYSGMWALPGGFVDVERDADLEQCAARKLQEKSGVTAPYLEQLGSWGSARRDPRGWAATHAYFALIPADAAIAAGANAADTQWFAVKGTAVKPKLAFDHAEILATAIERLRSKVDYTSLPAYLVPAEFTLSELQKAFETILDRRLEKSAFRTRVMAAGLVQATKKRRAGANRPAILYKLKDPGSPVIFARTFSPRGKGKSSFAKK